MNISLDKIKPETAVTVLQIDGGWGVRHRLNQLGIHIGDKVYVKRGGPLGGPILIIVHNIHIALGRGMAHHIHVLQDGV